VKVNKIECRLLSISFFPFQPFFTGFTHPRRLAILRLLREGNPVYAEDIAAITRISLPALSRHLSKLRVRGLVVYDGGKWALTLTRDPLAQTLLALFNASE
jgi:predicted transcriptional regulator